MQGPRFLGYVRPNFNLQFYNVHERYPLLIIASDWFVILIIVRSVNFDFKGVVIQTKMCSWQ